jgi:hypothetical protein
MHFGCHHLAGAKRRDPVIHLLPKMMDAQVKPAHEGATAARADQSR